MVRKEVAFFLFVFLLAAAYTFLPHLWAGRRTPPGYVFSGFNSFFDPWDTNFYLDIIRQGQAGQWLWISNFTSEPQTPVPLHLFYLFLGQASRVLYLSPVAVYHLASFFFLIIFLTVLYFFARFFIKERFWRWLYLLTATFGGGLIYFFSPDLNLLQTFHLPHFLLDQTLFLLILLLGFRLLEDSAPVGTGSFVIAGLGFLLALIHPYTLFVADVVLGAFLLVLTYSDRCGTLSRGQILLRFWRRAISLMPLVLVSLFVVSFHLWLIRLSSVVSGWLSQQVLLTPSLPELFLYYFPLSFLALLGVVFFWRAPNKDLRLCFLFTWFFVHLSLLYLPVIFQRLMIKSFFAVLSLVAVYALQQLGRRSLWLVGYLLFSFFPFVFLPQILLLGWRLEDTQPENFWVYRTTAEEQATAWLEAQVGRKGVILASYETSNWLPHRARVRVFLGLRDNTLNFLAKESQTARFYRGQMTEEEAETRLRQGRISHIFYGLREKKLGRFLDNPYTFLRAVFQNEEVKIFAF